MLLAQIGLGAPGHALAQVDLRSLALLNTAPRNVRGEKDAQFHFLKHGHLHPRRLLS